MNNKKDKCENSFDKVYDNNDLLSKLTDYVVSGYVPMHMPGGKRNSQIVNMMNPYELDITEIDGFDNMHNANGIISDAFKKCAKLFGADESLFLVNGSSAGILAAICGCTQKNDRILVARNCHCSVYNALYLNELRPVYMYPQVDEYGINGRITLDMIKEKLKIYKDIRYIVITSPTYEGIVSDIRGIADYLHKNNKILIVDEAHGAHFNFSKVFPESAVKAGADVVIQSVHKTLPALTQTALLHLNGSIADRDKIKRYWNIFQTTSPSYILMSSIDRCCSILNKNGEQLFKEYITRLKNLRMQIEKLDNIKLMPVDDISKIVLVVSNGKQFYNELLNKYHIQLEMASMSYVIAMTSIADTDEYYERFINALKQLDKNENIKYDHLNNVFDREVDFSKYEADVVMNLYDAGNYYKTEYVDINQAEDRISAVSVFFYPPGVALVNPGERITAKLIKEVIAGIKVGLETVGLNNIEKKVCIRCLK